EIAFPNQYSELNRNKIARNAASSWTQSRHFIGSSQRPRLSPAQVLTTFGLPYSGSAVASMLVTQALRRSNSPVSIRCHRQTEISGIREGLEPFLVSSTHNLTTNGKILSKIRWPISTEPSTSKRTLCSRFTKRT